MLLCYLFSVNIVLLFTQFILRENNNSWTPCRPSLKPKLPMFWPRNTHKSHYSLLPDLKILHRLHILWFVGHLAARFIICSVLLQQMCSFLSIMFSGAKVHRLSEGYSNIFYHTNIIKVVTKKKKKDWSKGPHTGYLKAIPIFDHTNIQKVVTKTKQT